MEGSDSPVDAVVASLGEGVLALSEDRGDTIMVVDRVLVRDVIRMLRDGEGKFVHLSSVCGVDYSAMGLEPRFAVVYHLYSPSAHRRLTLKVPLEDDDPVLPSVVDLFPTANWHERETFDMFGIRFDGHPNLTRILMPEDADFHPLRKDVPIGGEEVEFSHNVGVSRSGLEERDGD